MADPGKLPVEHMDGSRGRGREELVQHLIQSFLQWVDLKDIVSNTTCYLEDRI
jgi:hypothetical protein